MATPTASQAAEFQQRQAIIAAAAGSAVIRSIRLRLPWVDVATQIGTYQRAAVTAAAQTIAAWAESAPTVDATAFAGVSSQGFSVLEPVIATIDHYAPAPPEAVPPPWWDDDAAWAAKVEALIADEVADAGRTASQAQFVDQGARYYVRMLRLPSCDRCAILAGRVYRNLDGFARHPGCDCVMVPVESEAAARGEGLVTDVEQAVRDGEVSGLSKADRRAIIDGADPVQVVNAKRAGVRAPAGRTNAVTAEVFGRQVKATTYGTTKRAQWRRENPSRLVRLRPESLYAFARDDADARRLLRLYGYIR